MTGNDIPDGDNVVRYVGGSYIEDGHVITDAFRLSPGRDRLSVNWLEYFSGLDKPEQLSEIRRLSRISMGINGRLIELNVGTVKDYVRSKWREIRFVHSPLDATENYDADPSHGDITGLPPTNNPQSAAIGDLIAECVIKMHPTREV